MPSQALPDDQTIGPASPCFTTQRFIFQKILQLDVVCGSWKQRIRGLRRRRAIVRGVFEDAEAMFRQLLLSATATLAMLLAPMLSGWCSRAQSPAWWAPWECSDWQRSE